MNNKALVVIDLQNDITKNYRLVIESVNSVIDRAAEKGISIVYIRHANLSPGTKSFTPGSRGFELVPELKVVSENIFTKTKASVLTCEDFTAFIAKNSIDEFFVCGADATGCVKSACFNLCKAGYSVHAIADCITSYDLKKLPDMLQYYSSKGCALPQSTDPDLFG